MTVRADDIAFRDLGQELVTTLQLHFRQRESLFGRVPMIEIHLDGVEPTAAVDTTTIAKGAEEVPRRGLSSGDPLDLAVPVRCSRSARLSPSSTMAAR